MGWTHICWAVEAMTLSDALFELMARWDSDLSQELDAATPDPNVCEERICPASNFFAQLLVESWGLWRLLTQMA
jgi:hypothetical protein